MSGGIVLNEQLSLFSVDSNSFFIELQNVLDSLIYSCELPPHSLHLYSNLSSKGENYGKEISKSICIYEPEFPLVKEDVDNPGRNYVVMNIQVKNKIELLIRNKQFESIDLPSNAVIKNVKSDKRFIHVIFSLDDASVFSYIKENVVYCLKHYRSKEKTFSCCSRFEECSDAKKCVHQNKLYSTACYYRHNLEEGRIFYGKNKNNI